MRLGVPLGSHLTCREWSRPFPSMQSTCPVSDPIVDLHLASVAVPWRQAQHPPVLPTSNVQLLFWTVVERMKSSSATWMRREVIGVWAAMVPSRGTRVTPLAVCNGRGLSKWFLTVPSGQMQERDDMLSEQSQTMGLNRQLKDEAASLVEHCTWPTEFGRNWFRADLSTIHVRSPSEAYCRASRGRKGDVADRMLSLRSFQRLVSPGCRSMVSWNSDSWVVIVAARVMVVVHVGQWNVS